MLHTASPSLGGGERAKMLELELNVLNLRLELMKAAGAVSPLQGGGGVGCGGGGGGGGVRLHLHANLLWLHGRNLLLHLLSRGGGEALLLVGRGG